MMGSSWFGLGFWMGLYAGALGMYGAFLCFYAGKAKRELREIERKLSILEHEKWTEEGSSSPPPVPSP